MPLYAILDPQPTKEELAPYLQEALRRHPGLREDGIRFLAWEKWRESQLALNDSAFLVPFATEVSDYMGYKKRRDGD